MFSLTFVGSFRENRELTIEQKMSVILKHEIPAVYFRMFCLIGSRDVIRQTHIPFMQLVKQISDYCQKQCRRHK